MLSAVKDYNNTPVNISLPLQSMLHWNKSKNTDAHAEIWSSVATFKLLKDLSANLPLKVCAY